MSDDYAYCNSEKCIHRRGCKRFVGNHFGIIHSEKWINEAECRNEDGEEDYDGFSAGFIYLDRFRYSDGSPMPDAKK